MSKDGNSEQFDADIQQCKEDILRLRDIIPGGDPPKKQKPPQEPNLQKQIKKTAGKDTPPIPIEVKPAEPKPAVSTEVVKTEVTEKKAEIPKFDLAENIMAEHRKTTATKRKGPGQEIKPQIKVQSQEPKVEAVRRTIARPRFSNEDKIIAEIVARDIESLCRS